ncbi:MAG: rhomboid family intramembrane serine protease, partial [Planctomycetota bacterium]
MFFFFPYGTDAPKYHYPIVTLVVIALNVIVFFFTGLGDYQDHRWLILNYDQINPLQWVTAAFMHAGFAHLIGNMVFLWVFGQIVEGKTGNWLFAASYLTLASVFGAVVQIPMFLFFGGEGGALGASGV